MTENLWAALWALAGVPFAVVCTIHLRREGAGWWGLLPGVCLGLMFGPASLLMIIREHEREPEPEPQR